MRKYLCLIAGRAGSKRLPGKNLLPLCGKTLLAHTVEQAKLAKAFTTIAISSDSDEILSAAQAAGANLLIKRPPELASDEASSLDVIKHAVESLAAQGENFDTVVFLQITSPLRTPADIRKAIEIFEEKPVSSLLSVVKAKAAKNPVGDGYDINGAIYIWDKQKFLAEPKHIYPDTRLMVMPAHRSLDIDYQTDLEMVAAIMEKGEYQKGDSYAAN